VVFSPPLAGGHDRYDGDGIDGIDGPLVLRTMKAAVVKVFRRRSSLGHYPAVACNAIANAGASHHRNPP
jgi:hypothetical protein